MATVCKNVIAGTAANLKLCKVGAFTSLLGIRSQVLIVLGKQKGAVMAIFVRRKLMISTITTSSMPSV